MVPAARWRVLAACAISWPKSKVMSSPASGWPNSLPLQRRDQRQVQLAAVPGIAQLVGRDRDRREGAWPACLEEAEALGQLGRDQVAQRHVVERASPAGCACAPPRRAMPIGTSSVITATSASKSMPQASSASDDRRRAGRGRRRSRPGTSADRSRSCGGISAPRALRTSSTWIDVGRAVGPLVGARQRRGAAPRRRARTSPAPCRRARAARRAPRERCGARRRPVVERLPAASARSARHRHRARQVARSTHDQRAVAAAVLRAVASFTTPPPASSPADATTSRSRPLDAGRHGGDVERVARVDHHRVFVGLGLAALGRQHVEAPWDAGRA